jgi:ankyrin repeat protein
MVKNKITYVIKYIFVAFLFTQAIPFSAAAGTKAKQVPALIRAIREGESEKADELILKKNGINDLDEYGWSPLMYAVLNKDSERVDQLISIGADLNTQDKDGITPLIAAIIQMPQPFMKKYSPERDTRPDYIAINLILKGADPNLADNDGNAPLLYAVLGGQDMVIEALIKKGADPNRPDSRGYTPLYLIYHPDEAVEWAPATGALRRNFQTRRIRYGADGTSANVPAEVVKARKEAATMINQNRFKIAELLKSAGAVEPDVTKMKPIGQNLIDSMPKKLGSYQDQVGPFINILYQSGKIKEGDWHYLLLVNVVPTGTVNNVLVMSGLPNGLSEKLQAAAYKLKYQPAMKQGQPVESWDIIEGTKRTRSVNNASIPNKSDSVDPCSKEDGLTPLMCAARDNEYDLFKKGLKRTTDINARDIYGWTALTYSVAQGNYEMTQMLLSKNADPNISDTDGRSILMHAINFNNDKIAILLITSNVDVTVRDKKGATALGLAWSKSKSEIVALLEKAGAPQLKPEDGRSEIYSESLPENGPFPILNPTFRPSMEINQLIRGMKPGDYRMKIRVLVASDGTVRKVRVLAGLPHGITAWRMQELYASRYRPAVKDGQPVEAWTSGDYSFTKRDPSMNIIR